MAFLTSASLSVFGFLVLDVPVFALIHFGHLQHKTSLRAVLCVGRAVAVLSSGGCSGLCGVKGGGGNGGPCGDIRKYGGRHAGYEQPAFGEGACLMTTDGRQLVIRFLFSCFLKNNAINRLLVLGLGTRFFCC